MKAYQIKIELIGSKPLIWRRVIMPADVTFGRLHQVIQHVFCFKSWDVLMPYHLFEFNLPEENLRVTNDEDAYEQHKHYKKNAKMIEEQLKNMENEFTETYLKNLRIEVRKPTALKIDKYIEKYEEINYTYDFGDNWRMLVTLEEIREDHYYGYPILLDGAENGPPEDVGGLDSYYECLEIYNDPTHGEYEQIRNWAKDQFYREYDKEWINRILKDMKYKKTEWDKIDIKA